MDKSCQEKQSGQHDDLEREAAHRGLRKTGSRTLGWDTDHRDFPRNWPLRRKLYDVCVIFFLEFYTTVMSTTGPSAAEEAMSEYAMSRVVMLTGFQFMYGAGQALGGLIMPPFSESLGRQKSYLVSAGAYSLSSLLVGLVPSPAGVFIGRFFSGFASSVPAVVLAGSIEDLYTQQPRLWLLWFWNCSTMLGIAVGPIYGSYIVDAIGWRWVYHVSAITCAVTFFLLIPVRESRPTTLLQRRFDNLQSKVGAIDMDIPNPDRINSTRELAQVILVRPAKIGVSEPILILVSILSASAWGMMYLFTESFTVVYSGFGWTSTLSGLTTLFGNPQAPKSDKKETKKREDDGSSGDNVDSTLTPGSAPQRRLLIHASSKHLTFACPQFERTLQTGFREGTKLRATGCLRFPVQDWEAKPFLILMLIIHHRSRMVPRQLSLHMLVEMARLVDYYECYEAVEVFSGSWLIGSNFTSGDPRSVDEAEKWLFVSWVFNQPRSFLASSKYLKSRQTSDSNFSQLPVPHAIQAAINGTRRGLIAGAIHSMHSFLSKLQNGPNWNPLTECYFKLRGDQPDPIGTGLSQHQQSKIL
ncbi:major facilitator superfamily domain-containing protein [Aspergillus parasiticus]|uniref:Major facilitator superfamily domain-containing protein n=1 Tax=Aspergillus parasiticus TaxID=5067 RepID=A0A5N6E241_ASPPA|nr:major facilitator superfamily domain-containing protein [Aspergillus parasiticus]